MTTRRRLTQSADRKASAPPATPGYMEGTNHPAYTQPDPDADQYMNGDPSSWAEDPHPGPYPNPAPPPADPGMQSPQGHPATDPKHYFPAGVGKEASRNLRAAMELKASKCIRIAQAMFGRKASVEAIEDQALDLMNLSDRQIQAMLGRIAEQAKEGPEANYTLTPPRTGDLLADDMLVEDDDVIVPASKAAKKSEEDADESAEEEIEEGVKPEDEAEAAAKKAAHFSRLAAFWSKAAKKAAEDEKEEEPKEEPKKEARKLVKADGQNDPATYNYTAGDDSDEEELLVEMMAEEALKQAKAARAAKQKLIAKKSGDEEPDGDEAKKSEDEEPKKEAKKSEDEAKEEEPEESAEDEEGADKKACADGEMLSEMLAGLGDPTADEDPFMDDPMALMDGTDDMGMSDDEMSLLYGGRFAKKSEDKEPDGDEAAEEEPKEAKSAAARTAAAKRTAALKPQPRLASTGVKTLGAVSKTAASSEISDLSKLWESAPDVSKIFG